MNETTTTTEGSTASSTKLSKQERLRKISEARQKARKSIFEASAKQIQKKRKATASPPPPSPPSSPPSSSSSSSTSSSVDENNKEESRIKFKKIKKKSPNVVSSANKRVKKKARTTTSPRHSHSNSHRAASVPPLARDPQSSPSSSYSSSDSSNDSSSEKKKLSAAEKRRKVQEARRRASAAFGHDYVPFSSPSKQTPQRTSSPVVDKNNNNKKKNMNMPKENGSVRTTRRQSRGRMSSSTPASVLMKPAVTAPLIPVAAATANVAPTESASEYSDAVENERGASDIVHDRATAGVDDDDDDDDDDAIDETTDRPSLWKHLIVASILAVVCYPLGLVASPYIQSSLEHLNISVDYSPSAIVDTTTKICFEDNWAEGYKSEKEEGEFACEDNVIVQPCPPFGLCTGGSLIQCEDFGNLVSISELKTSCELSSYTKNLISNVERALSKMAVDNICSAFQAFSSSKIVFTFDELHRFMVKSDESMASLELSSLFQKLDVLISEENKFAYDEENISFTDEYVSKKLDIPFSCYCSIFILDNLKASLKFLLSIFWSLIWVGIEYPLISCFVLVVTFLFWLPMRRMKQRNKETMDVAILRETALDILGELEGQSIAVVHLRDQALDNLYPTSLKRRRQMKDSVWPKVEAVVSHDTRVRKLHKSHKGATQIHWEWISTATPKIKRRNVQFDPQTSR